MKKITKLVIKGALVSIMLTGTMFVNAGFAQTGSWVAPKDADAKTSTVKDATVAATKGKTLFNQSCTACHGTKAKGDGPAGASLKPKPADLTSSAFLSQKDGAIFWKLSEGKGTMPSYKKALTDEQRWQIVAYLRQLK